MSDPVLNINPGREDVVHLDPGEQCNTDDAEGRQAIDEDTAKALIALGEARACELCSKENLE